MFTNGLYFLFKLILNVVFFPNKYDLKTGILLTRNRRPIRHTAQTTHTTSHKTSIDVFTPKQAEWYETSLF